MSFADDILTKVRLMIEAYLERWPKVIAQSGGLPTDALPSGGDTGDGFTPAPHQHIEFHDAHHFWGRDLVNTIPEDGQAFVWNETTGAFVLDSVGSGDGGSTVPPPYTYIIDSDGYYLLDADGAYLYEDL